MLLWLVLFKFSYDPIGVISDFQTRSLNLIPFAWGRRGEMIANILAFIPFGVLLGVNFKQIAFKYKITLILAFSVVLEVIQYALAIGATDITDIIMNTAGGFAGLALYTAAAKRTQELDRAILVTGTLTLLVILYLRIFVFIVRY